MAFATFDFFAVVKAVLAFDVGAFDALRVQTSRLGMFVFTRLTTHLSAERVVDEVPSAVLTPCPKVMVDAFPVRVFAWQYSLLNAAD